MTPGTTFSRAMWGRLRSSIGSQDLLGSASPKAAHLLLGHQALDGAGLRLSTRVITSCAVGRIRARRNLRMPFGQPAKVRSFCVFGSGLQPERTTNAL